MKHKHDKRKTGDGGKKCLTCPMIWPPAGAQGPAVPDADAKLQELFEKGRVTL